MKIKILAGILLMIVIVSCNTEIKNSNEMLFITWENPCFDRCASIWLIQNYVDSTATFDFISFGEKVTKGIPFDVPGAELGRQKNICCFESVLQKYQLDDPAFLTMAKVIHDIDVNKWGVKVTMDADSLELVFKNLQAQEFTDQELLEKTEIVFVSMYNKYK